MEMDLNKAECEFVHKCKILAQDPNSHAELIQSDHFLEILAISLASPEPSIAKAALETLYLLSENRSNHAAISSTYGMIEAVNLASERLYDDKMSQLAKDIICILTGPAYGTRSRRKKQVEEQEKSQTKQINLCIEQLNLDNRVDLQRLLIQQKGIVSIHINLEEHLVTLRVLNKLSPRDLSKVIYSQLGMESKLLVKSEVRKQPMLVPLNDDSQDLPPYLPENDSPVHNKAVNILGSVKANASGLINWFQKSFYW